MSRVADNPVAIIGAGPIGLAVAANLAEHSVAFRVYEAGDAVGANVRDWAHVRIFTSWEQSIDSVSRRLLEASGWTLPAPAKAGACCTADAIAKEAGKPGCGCGEAA